MSQALVRVAELRCSDEAYAHFRVGFAVPGLQRILKVWCSAEIVGEIGIPGFGTHRLRAGENRLKLGLGNGGDVDIYLWTLAGRTRLCAYAANT